MSVCLSVKLFLSQFESDWDTIWHEDTCFKKNITVLGHSQEQEASLCQRVSKSVSKWPKKREQTDRQTDRHFHIYISRDYTPNKNVATAGYPFLKSLRTGVGNSSDYRDNSNEFILLIAMVRS